MATFVFVRNAKVNLETFVLVRSPSVQLETFVLIRNAKVRSDFTDGVIPPAGPPFFTQQPQDDEVVEGNTATFTVVASRATSYQWQLDSGGGFSDISGATSASYTTPVLGLSDDGNVYRCIATNAAGSVTSDGANLGVIVAPPVVTEHPSSTTVLEGEHATFEVAATGAETYQWQVNTGAGFVNISGANSMIYATPPLAYADNGNTYRCVVTNPGGSVTSNAATLTVTAVVGLSASYDDLAATYDDLEVSYA